MESNILRFLAKLITDSPIDKDRKLIISYFLSDDTISVFELVQRNSGEMYYVLQSLPSCLAHLIRAYNKHCGQTALAEAGMWISKCSGNYISRSAALACIAECHSNL